MPTITSRELQAAFPPDNPSLAETCRAIRRFIGAVPTRLRHLKMTIINPKGCHYAGRATEGQVKTFPLQGQSASDAFLN